MKYSQKLKDYRRERKTLQKKYSRWNQVAIYINWVIFVAFIAYVLFTSSFNLIDIAKDTWVVILNIGKWLFQIPIDIHTALVTFYNFIEGWAIKLWEGKSWKQALMFLFWGIIRRLVIEDILIPTLIQYYFKKISRSLKVYIAMQQIKIAQFSKGLRLTISLVFVGPLGFVAIFFEGLSGAWFLVKKFILNQVLSILKKVFIKWLPLLLTTLFEMFPILQFLLEFAFLRAIINWLSWFKPLKWIIDIATNAIDKVGLFLDEQVNRRIGKYLKYAAIKTKYFFRSRIKANNFDVKHLNDILVRKQKIAKARKIRIANEKKQQKLWKIKKWTTIIVVVSIFVYSIWVHF